MKKIVLFGICILVLMLNVSLINSDFIGSDVTNKEIIEKRTANSKHYRNEDGTITAEFYTSRIHFFDGDKWIDLKELSEPLIEKKDIILNKKPSTNIFKFGTYRLHKGITASIENHTLVLKDANNDIVKALQRPYSYDVRNDTIDCDYRIKQNDNSLNLFVEVDFGWLERAVYPVVIDPYLKAVDGKLVVVDSESFYGLETDGDLTGRGRQSYSAAHLAAAYVDTGGKELIVGQRSYVSGWEYFVYRSYIAFDTSSIPNAVTIISATLNLYGAQDMSDTDFSVQVYQGGWTPTLTLDDWNAWTGSSLASLHTSNFKLAYMSFSGLQSAVNPYGVSQYVLISKEDVDGSVPTTNEYVVFNSAKGQIRLPKLSVEYAVFKCSPGTTQSCGNCGTQTCNKYCQWDRCIGQGVCSPGRAQSQACGNCGTQTSTCQSNCQWGSWGSCTGEGCPPGSTKDTGIDYCTDNSLYNRIDKCSSGCQWYDDGAASDTLAKSCCDDGSATTGETADNPATKATCTAGKAAGCSGSSCYTKNGNSGTDYCQSPGVAGAKFIEYYAYNPDDACGRAYSCTAKEYDPDTNSNTCTTCLLQFVKSGESLHHGEYSESDISAGKDECCGDDANEYYRVSTGADNDGTAACCEANDKCVMNNVCYADESCLDGLYCNSGVWRLLDFDEDGIDNECETYDTDPCSVSDEDDNCNNAMPFGTNCAIGSVNYCTNCLHCGDGVVNCGEICEGTVCCTNICTWDIGATVEENCCTNTGPSTVRPTDCAFHTGNCPAEKGEPDTKTQCQYHYDYSGNHCTPTGWQCYYSELDIAGKHCDDCDKNKICDRDETDSDINADPDELIDACDLVPHNCNADTDESCCNNLEALVHLFYSPEGAPGSCNEGSCFSTSWLFEDNNGYCCGDDLNEYFQCNIEDENDCACCDTLTDQVRNGMCIKFTAAVDTGIWVEEPPIINISCLRDNEWIDCRNLIYGDLIKSINVSCGRLDIDRINLTLVNVYDNNIVRKLSQAEESQIGAMFETGHIIDKVDYTIQDSGDWIINIQCIAQDKVVGTADVTWLVPWGELQPIVLTSNMSVDRGEIFVYEINITCVGGECPDIKASLDPYEDFEEDYTKINILNKQSYPELYGNWVVEFNTDGKDDLVITPVDGTSFGEDLEFLELRCGDRILSPDYDGTRIFYEGYSCDETGYEISKVLTTGEHTLEFEFGGIKVSASNFAGGDGSADNPYQITNCEQLQAMRTNLGANYVLMKDIDCYAYTHLGGSLWNGGEGFEPVGPFTGTFDGKNHIITGLFIDRPSIAYVGLFGNAGAEIKNISLVDVDITGYQLVGGLAGYNWGTISNSFSTGSVSASLNYIGGLVGRNYGDITNSYSIGSVSGSDKVGGLIGEMYYGTIYGSYAISTVTHVGTGGTSQIGGFVGAFREGTIENCWVQSTIQGSCARTGGFVGQTVEKTAIIRNSYSLSSLSCSNKCFIGYNQRGGPIDNSYYNNQLCTVGDSYVSGKTTAQMQTKSTFTNAGWDFCPGGTVWAIDDGESYPCLNWEYDGCKCHEPEEELIAIHDCTELQSIKDDCDAGGCSKTYVLDKDIDCTYDTQDPNGALYNGGEGFEPIGNSFAKFNGTFDGQNHTITGLFINRPSTDYVGLFGGFGYKKMPPEEAGEIKNVILVGVNITGDSYVGGLVGYTYEYESISNSNSTGTVNGDDSVGGLVGTNKGNVTNSYSTGSVNGSIGVGGLVGYNHGPIFNSYSTGNVTGAGNSVGGLVGGNSGTVTNSYSTGSVTAGYHVGGLVGVNYGGTITNSYSTGSVNGTDFVGGLVGGNRFIYVGGDPSPVIPEISNSYSTGSVNGSEDVGGLVGYNSRGTINNSYSTVNVSGTSHYVGGLVGRNNNGNITNSFSTGKVTSSGHDVGGLVGYNEYGNINNSYSTGKVTSSSYDVGGLVGTNYDGEITNSYSTGSVSGGGSGSAGGLAGLNRGTITNSYSTGNVSSTGDYYVSGLVGFNFAGGIITNSYWNNRAGNPDDCWENTTGVYNIGCTAIQDNEAYFYNHCNPPMDVWDFFTTPIWGTVTADPDNTHSCLYWQDGCGQASVCCECSGTDCESGNTGRRCDGCYWVVVSTTPEKCNKVDDDCDGDIDEDDVCVTFNCGDCGISCWRGECHDIGLCYFVPGLLGLGGDCIDCTPFKTCEDYADEGECNLNPCGLNTKCNYINGKCCEDYDQDGVCDKNEASEKHGLIPNKTEWENQWDEYLREPAFYTINENPIDKSINDCLSNLKAGESCNLTWQVKAVGEPGRNWTFFTIFESPKSEHVNSSKIIISINDVICEDIEDDYCPDEKCVGIDPDCGCGPGEVLCYQGDKYVCREECFVNVDCKNSVICDPLDSCACPECDNQNDACLKGLVCKDGKCDCNTDPDYFCPVDFYDECIGFDPDCGCGFGEVLCYQNGKYVCSKECLDPFKPAPCNSDNICDPKESCACPECDNENDTCVTGLICIDGKCDCNPGRDNLCPKDYVEQCTGIDPDCGCGPGTTLCEDGTCQPDCSEHGGDPECDNDKQCDVGESCACNDCNGLCEGCIPWRDSCAPGLICSVGGKCACNAEEDGFCPITYYGECKDIDPDCSISNIIIVYPDEGAILKEVKTRIYWKKEIQHFDDYIRYDLAYFNSSDEKWYTIYTDLQRKPIGGYLHYDWDISDLEEKSMQYQITITPKIIGTIVVGNSAYSGLFTICRTDKTEVYGYVINGTNNNYIEGANVTAYNISKDEVVLKNETNGSGYYSLLLDARETYDIKVNFSDFVTQVKTIITEYCEPLELNFTLDKCGDGICDAKENCHNCIDCACKLSAPECNDDGDCVALGEGGDACIGKPDGYCDSLETCPCPDCRGQNLVHFPWIYCDDKGNFICTCYDYCDLVEIENFRDDCYVCWEEADCGLRPVDIEVEGARNVITTTKIVMYKGKPVKVRVVVWS